MLVAVCSSTKMVNKSAAVKSNSNWHKTIRSNPIQTSHHPTIIHSIPFHFHFHFVSPLPGPFPFHYHYHSFHHIPLLTSCDRSIGTTITIVHSLIRSFPSILHHLIIVTSSPLIWDVLIWNERGKNVDKQFFKKF